MLGRCSIVAAAAALIVVATACAPATEGETRTPAKTAERSVSDGATLNDERVFDGTEYDNFSDPASWTKWASYALVVTVVSEQERPPEIISGTSESPVVADFSLRDLTVNVDDVVWAHPGALLAVTTNSTRRFDGIIGSAIRTDGTGEPLTGIDQDRMEIGERFLAIVADSVDDNNQQTLALIRAYSVSDGTITSGHAPPGLTRPADAARLIGTPADERLFPRAGEDLGARIVRTGAGQLGR